MKAIRILTLITALFSGAAAADDSTQATSPVSLTGEKAVAQLKESGQYDSIAAAYEAARHAVRADEAEPDGVLHAQNPGHGLSASFDRHGLQLSVQRHGTEGERLTTRWRLDSVGRDGAVEKVPAGDALRRDGQRAEIVRAGLGLTEWFVNRPSGLEHGFTLDRRPAGEGALRLDIAIEGDLSPVPAADGQRIELHDAAGTKVLDYDKLRVWDATGQELSARMEQAAAGGLRFQVEDAGASYPLTVDPTFNQQAYLKASNPGTTDFFGGSVAVSGDTAVVGAYQEDSSTTGINSSPNESALEAGAAYVFIRSGSTWTQQAYLKASNAGAGDRFGQWVAVSGDTVVVGALGEDSSTTGINSTPNESANGAGAAYVFVRSGSTWSQQAYLKASNTNTNDKFGWSVAVSDDTAVIGAVDESSNATTVNGDGTNNSASRSGAAYVFTRSGTTWSQQAYLKASNTGAFDLFGSSVAVDGDTAVIGAIWEDSNANTVNGVGSDSSLSSEFGAAYVFTRSGTTWSQQAYLKASNSGAADEFGTSVAVFGDTAVIGAPKESSNATTVNGNGSDNSASLSGAAYVFTRSGTTWSQQAYLKAANTGAGDSFGTSVAVSGDTVVIGAVGEDSSTTGINSTPNESANSSGAAYGFVRSGSTWTQQAYFKASNTGAGDLFGSSVAVSGDTVVIGATGEDSSTTGINSTPNESASNAGAAYGYALIPNPTLTGVVPSTGSPAGGTTVTLTGTGFTGAPSVTFGGTAATSVVVVNATTITCTTPARAAGVVSVLVTTPGGTNAANTLFTYSTAQAGFVNPGFEEPRFTPGVADFHVVAESTVPGWKTTASDGMIEFWTDGFGDTFGGGLPSVPPFQGAQFAELNANLIGALYQDALGIPAGVVVNFRFAHRGRLGVENLRVTITDLGPNGVPGSGDDTVIFTKAYATGKSAWVVYSSFTETPILALGNPVRFQFESLDAGGTGNFLDDCDFGTAVVSPPPTLSSVSPSTGSTAGGTFVTLTGTSFTGATSVTFGGTAATSVVVVNATTITCTTPARAAGTASVVVTTPAGTNAANTLFTYVAPSGIDTPTGLASLTTGTVQQINTTWFRDAQNGFIGTDGGGVRVTNDGGRTWTPSTTGVTNHIYAIREVDGVLFLAGANGLICRSINNGATWTTMTTGTTATFRALAFSSPTRGFAVGTGGTICIYNGTTWVAQNSGTTADFTGVSIVGNTAWAVGAGGVICRYDGTSWVPVNSGATGDFYDVSFLRENLGFAVGANGLLCRYNGTAWQQVPTGVTSAWRSVFVADDSTIVITGDGGLMCQSTDGGQTWQTLTVGSSVGLTAVGVAGGQAFAFGTGGAGFSFTVRLPTGLVSLNTGTERQINTTWFSDAQNGLIGTDGGVVRRTTDGGRTWTASNTGITSNIYAIRKVGNVAFFAGANGVICRSNDNGVTWTAQTTGTTQTFRALAFSSATSGFAVGTGGTICVYNGTTWTAQTSGTTAEFTGVSIVGNTAWAVGAGGVICRYNGTSWATVTSGVTIGFTSVSFLSGNLGYAVGDGGLICRYNGTAWVQVTSGVTIPFRSVVIADENTIVISGDGGLICQSTDGGLTWQTFSVGSAGMAAVSVAGGQVFTFGTGGAGFCYTISLPSGLVGLTTGTQERINATDFSDAQNGLIGTNGGGVRRTSDGGRTWTTSTTGITSDIYAIRKVGAVAFFAGANGVICRSNDNGVTWTAQTTGTTQTFRALAFSSATSGFAVGTGGTICVYNGTTWTAQASGTTVELTGVSIVGNTAWAVGVGGVICRYNGTSWATVTSGVTIGFTSVSFLRENLGYAVGAGGLICRYNGTSWVQVTSGLNIIFRSVVIADENTIVISGDGGLICQSTDGGLTWQTLSVGSGVMAAVTVAGGQVFTFGTGGAGYCYSISPPGGLAGVTTGTQEVINAASFSDAQNGFIATDNGGVRVTTNGGQTWTTSNTGVTSNINAISQVDGVAFLAGANGVICRYNGTTWVAQATGGTTEVFQGLAFSSATSGFAVGTGGTICIYNGTTWVPQTTGTTADFTGVSIVGTTAWAVGTGGIICRYNGTSWAPVNSGVTTNFYAVDFLRPDFGFAVGAGGVICRYNGTSWVAVNSGVTSAFRSVVIADENTIVISGDGGLVCRSTDGGLTWQTLAVGSSASLNALVVTGGDVLVFGAGGAGYEFSVSSAPTLTSVSPNSGTTAGGTAVTLTGTGFTGATSVTFGGTAATAVAVVNATTITCTTPIRAAGAASVLVTTPGGANAANTLFTYVAPPVPRREMFSYSMSGRVGTNPSAAATFLGGTVFGNNGWQLNGSPLAANTVITFTYTIPDTAVDTDGSANAGRFTGGTLAVSIPSMGVNSATTPAFHLIFNNGAGDDQVIFQPATNSGFSVVAAWPPAANPWPNSNVLSTVANPNAIDIIGTSPNSIFSLPLQSGHTLSTSFTELLANPVFSSLIVPEPTGLTTLNTGTAEQINTAWFSDAQNGFIATDNGGVRVTTNGGQTWTTSNTGVITDIYGIREVGGVAFLAGANGVICRSTDNGTTWTAQATGTTATFRGLAFSSATSGFAVGTGGTICIYNGTTWVPQTTGTTADFTGVSIVGTTAWAVGTGGVICRYNGTSWAPVNSGVTANFYAVAFLREDFGFAVGAGGLICRYNGTSWVAVNSGVTSALRSVVIVDANTIVTSGDDGLICQSTDGGLTWQTLSVGTSASLTTLALAESEVLAFGDGGAGFAFFVNPPPITPFRITAFSYNPTARTVDLIFLSEPGVNYTIETSLNGQTWTVLGAPVPGAGGATSTTVTGRPLQPPYTDRLLLRVRRP